MHQPMQGSRRQAKGEREYNADLVIDRVIAAIHDHGTRAGATKAKVMRALKDEGFTAGEIAEAARRMTTHIERE